MKVRLVLTAAAVLFVGVIAATPASAQYVGVKPPVLAPVAAPTVEVERVVTPVEVQVGREVRVTPFAVTGADVVQLVVIGGVLVLGGALLVRQGRRRCLPSGS